MYHKNSPNIGQFLLNCDEGTVQALHCNSSILITMAFLAFKKWGQQQMWGKVQIWKCTCRAIYFYFTKLTTQISEWLFHNRYLNSLLKAALIIQICILAHEKCLQPRDLRKFWGPAPSPYKLPLLISSTCKVWNWWFWHTVPRVMQFCAEIFGNGYAS